MSKILIDIGSLCTKINFVGRDPLMISSSADYILDFSVKFSTIEYYSKFPDCKADFPYYESTFFSRNKLIDTTKYSNFLGHCFNLLNCDPSEANMIVLIPPIDQESFVAKTSEILFETYNCPKLSMISQSFFADEHKNFVSVMTGFSDTYILPYINCQPCSKSLRHIPIGGHQITEFISSSLKQRPQNQYIEEENFMWMSEQIKLSDRFPYFDSNIDIDDFKHSTPLKTIFKLHPITKKKEFFTFGYERYLGTSCALLPGNIDPSLNYTLAEQINESIKSAVVETKSISHMEKTLKNRISVVGGPASARGIKYKLHNLFKSKKLKSKLKKNVSKNDQANEENKDSDTKKEAVKKKKDDDKNDDSKKETQAKDPITQIFITASRHYEKIDNIFITNESYKEDHANCLLFACK